MRTFTLYGINYTWFFSRVFEGGILRTPNFEGMVTTRENTNGDTEYIGSVRSYWPITAGVKKLEFTKIDAILYVEQIMSQLTEEEILWGAP